MQVVLASGSPRRQQLLAEMGVDFEVHPPDIDESPILGEAPIDYVRRLALEKSRAVRPSHPQALLISADTTVDFRGMVVGQPKDQKEARQILNLMSSATHLVHTAICLGFQNHEVCDLDTTAVTFGEITPELLEWYLQTQEPFGKAGAYAIQGLGSRLVSSIEGEITTVIGFSVPLFLGLVERIGLDIKAISGR